MATHSSTLAWQVPWTEEPGGLQSMGSLGVGHDWTTSLSLFTFVHWRRKWQPTPVFLPGESQGWGSLVGCHLWGRRVGHDWSDLAAAAAAKWINTFYLCSPFIFKCSYFITYFVCAMLCLVAQSCPTLCDPPWSPPDSSVHGILQEGILEWAAMPSSRGSSQPRNWTRFSWIAGGFFTSWATSEALFCV